jgi:hypothetical protein
MPRAAQFDSQCFAQALTVAAGVIYSAILVLVFLPVYVELNRFDRNLRTKSQQLDKDRILTISTGVSKTSEAISPSNVPILKSLLTLLSPLLTAVVTLIASQLKELFFK